MGLSGTQARKNTFGELSLWGICFSGFWGLAGEPGKPCCSRVVGHLELKASQQQKMLGMD